MKKYFSLIILLLLITIKVNALENANIIVNCPNDKVKKDTSIKCDVELSYTDISFSNISFELESDLDVTFVNSIGTLKKEEKVINISFDNEIDNLVNIGNINISKANNGKVMFNNIRLLNDSEEVYKIDDIVKEIKVLEGNLDSNCDLNGIIVNGVPVKNFNKDVLHYEPIYVNSQSVFVDAVRSSDKSNVSGLGNMRVRENRDVTRVITVVAEDGTKKEYTLVLRYGEEEIKKEDETPLPDKLSSDATLNLIELHSNGKKINFNFKKEQTTYIVKLDDNDITNINVQAELSDSKADFVPNFGPREVNIDYGTNKIEIKVVAEDKTENVYTLNIMRDDKRSDNSLLSSLEINNKKVELKDDELSYDITLDKQNERTNVSLETQSDKATVEYEEIELNDGENNLLIRVTAENGHQSEYNIKIYRIESKEASPFENISISGYEFSFDMNKFEYDLYFDDIPKKLNITVNPQDILHEISNNDNLKDGSIVMVKIIDDSAVRNYAFNIHDKANLQRNSNLIYYAFLGISILLLIISIVHAIKINKKKK